jgi:hypothetical protein
MRLIRARELVHLTMIFGIAWFIGFVLRLGADNTWKVNIDATEEELNKEPESHFVHGLYVTASVINGILCVFFTIVPCVFFILLTIAIRQQRRRMARMQEF